MTTPSTRNILERSAADMLQQYLYPEGLPPFMRPYRKSPELMTIFFYLFMSDLEVMYESAAISADLYKTIDQKIATILCAGTRDVVRYKVIEPFVMSLGILKKHIDLPRYITEARLRQCYEGDTILLRTDTKMNTTEVQICSTGLFEQDHDAAIFNLDNAAFSIYNKHIKREQRINEGFKMP